MHVYACVRHPQYAGLFRVTIAMLVQWPTIIAVTTWPVLLAVYYRLARREEREGKPGSATPIAGTGRACGCSCHGSADRSSHRRPSAQ